jgi:hypothetical protein
MFAPIRDGFWKGGRPIPVGAPSERMDRACRASDCYTTGVDQVGHPAVDRERPDATARHGTGAITHVMEEA